MIASRTELRVPRDALDSGRGSLPSSVTWLLHLGWEWGKRPSAYRLVGPGACSARLVINDEMPFICTRELGHSADHVCHDVHGEPRAAWKKLR